MTASHDDCEFADIDSYITSQLSKAAVALADHPGTRARLEAVLRARGHDRIPSGAAEVPDDG